MEADSKARDGSGVEPRHGEAEGDGQHQIRKAIHGKATFQRTLNAEPNDDDDGESGVEPIAHGHKERRIGLSSAASDR